MTTRTSLSLALPALAPAAAVLLAAGPALAHHVSGGMMPASLADGLLSGIGHPIIGVDHLLFVVGVGLIAARLAAPLLLPAAFVAGTVGGSLVHLAALDIPFAEIAILVSVALMAAAVILPVTVDRVAAAGLLAVAGLFHGFAYGEAVFGAEPTPVLAYLVGFSLVQFAIAAGTCLLFRRVAARRGDLATAGARVAGGAMAGVVMVAASNLLFGL